MGGTVRCVAAECRLTCRKPRPRFGRDVPGSYESPDYKGAWVFQARKSKLPLPPGPTKLPIIGNLLSMPSKFEWETYAKWAREYKSDIIHLGVAGTNLIILDRPEATRELLDKRSAIYSSRPHLTMVGELMGWDTIFALMPYGDEWRAQRRLSHRVFQSDNAHIRYFAAQTKARHTFLKNLLAKNTDDSKRVDIMAEVKHMAGSAILSLTYGIDTLPKNDPYISAADNALDAFCIAARPGAFLVDAIPALKYLPQWFPGSEFKRTAREWGGLLKRMLELPFETAKNDYHAGVSSTSFVAYALDQLDESEDRKRQEERIQCVAGTVYTGGVDSSLALLSHFFHAMLAYPDTQKKAQEELDRALGGALPTFDDLESGRLPYMTALVKECLRWRSVAPMGFPHIAAEDDVYNGYMIPKGSIVLANLWSMMHDPSIYPDPEQFMPERFLNLDGRLKSDILSPEDIVFGFGRRICPARILAFSSVWMVTASTLAVFNVSKAVDKNGRVIEPTYECKSTLAYMPVPFECSIQPRKGAAILLGQLED